MFGPHSTPLQSRDREGADFQPPARRQILSGALALAGTSACHRQSARQPAPSVAIHKSPGYGQHLYDLVRRIIAVHGLQVAGKRVLLKPNLVEFDETTAINTHPLLVHAAFEAFTAAGASEVRIAEGPGHRRITLDLASAAGYFSTVPKFETRFTDLNVDDVAKIPLRKPRSKLTGLYLPKTVLGCDLLVSLPKMKTHHWVGATLSMKNFFGLVPGGVYGWPKNVLHWAGIDECIADIFSVVPKTFAIVDGIEGMEGNGPIQGTPKHAGVIVAGSHLPAVDSTCCRIMGIDPRRIRYLGYSTGAAVLASDGVKQTAETIAAVAQSFRLPPHMEGLRLA